MFSGFIRKIKRPKNGCTQSEWDKKIERERYNARAEEREIERAEKKKERDLKIKAAAKKGKNAFETFAGDMYHATKVAAKGVGKWGEWQGDEFLGKHQKATKRRTKPKVKTTRRKATTIPTRMTTPRKTAKKRTAKKKQVKNYEWV